MPRKNTRNAQGNGTIRKRPDGRWEARFTVGRDPGTGKQIQKSIYGKTQTEVRKKLQQTCSEIDNGTYVEPTKLTVSNWLDIWLEEYTANLKPYTLKSYTGIINNHIKPSIGSVKLNSLSTHTIQGFYNKSFKGTNLKQGLSPKTVKNIHGVLHKALEQASNIGYIKFNPTNSCTLPRMEKSEIKPLEYEEIVIFLKAIQGHKFEKLYIVDLFTGMRQGEILGLTWDCIDFQKGTIRIYQQLQKIQGEYKFVSLKNDKGRKIAPAPSVIAALKEHKKCQIQWKLRAGDLWNDTNLVFTNELGEHLTHVTVYKNFKRIVNQIGIPSARFHDLRHTYAVAALQAGDDVKTVQENLGHHTASFTLDVYGHVSEKMKQESANRMENYIKGIKNL